MMIRFCDESIPDLLEPLSLASRLGLLVEVAEEVEAGIRPLVVKTLVRVLLPLTVTTVVRNCCVRLLTDLDTVWVSTRDGSVDPGPEVEVLVDCAPVDIEVAMVDVES